MRKFLTDKQVLKNCKIYGMLAKHAGEKHLSFHTPGHKKGKWDVTELSFSDNLSSPRGCIAQAEKEIAETLGAHRSFLVTDGSTAGVLAMLYAAKTLGVKKIAVSESSHKSVFNGCKAMGITPLVYTEKEEGGIPFPPTMYELKAEFTPLLEEADALFITSPTYYGRVADLAELRRYCDEKKKLLLIDGAHGGHLHFDKKIYAGAYADMWVDGVHKSLPAFTQGAVVSARAESFANALREGVGVFRTTSPSYPIMASVEYAVKYPQNQALEREVREYAHATKRAYLADDWTKLSFLFGETAFEAEKELEAKGIYAEFCDGNVLMFYLSPALTLSAFRKLKKEMGKLLEKYPYTPKKAIAQGERKNVSRENTQKKWEELDGSVGKVCALACGLFPPCVPLICEGERIQQEKIDLLKRSANVYGLVDGKILVVKEDGYGNG